MVTWLQTYRNTADKTHFSDPAAVGQWQKLAKQDRGAKVEGGGHSQLKQDPQDVATQAAHLGPQHLGNPDKDELFMFCQCSQRLAI